MDVWRFVNGHLSAESRQSRIEAHEGEDVDGIELSEDVRKCAPEHLQNITEFGIVKLRGSGPKPRPCSPEQRSWSPASSSIPQRKAPGANRGFFLGFPLAGEVKLVLSFLPIGR